MHYDGYNEDQDDDDESLHGLTQYHVIPPDEEEEEMEEDPNDKNNNTNNDKSRRNGGTNNSNNDSNSSSISMTNGTTDSTTSSLSDDPITALLKIAHRYREVVVMDTSNINSETLILIALQYLVQALHPGQEPNAGGGEQYLQQRIWPILSLLVEIIRTWSGYPMIQCYSIDIISYCIQYATVHDPTRTRYQSYIDDLLHRYDILSIIGATMLNNTTNRSIQISCCTVLLHIMEYDSRYVTKIVVEHYGTTCYRCAMENFPDCYEIQRTGCQFFQLVGRIKNEILQHHNPTILFYGSSITDGIQKVNRLLQHVINRCSSSNKHNDNPNFDATLYTEALEALRMWEQI